MGQVKIDIGGRSFMVTCQDGEEEHLSHLGSLVNDKAGEAGDPAGLTESRMLLFTSLLLADELHGMKEEAAAQTEEKPEKSAENAVSEQALQALEKLAERTEQFANSLEQSANPS